MLAAIVALAAWAATTPPKPVLKPPAPSAVVLGDHEKANASGDHEGSNSNERGTEAVPLFVKIVPPECADEPANKGHCPEDKQASEEGGLILPTWLLALFTFGLFVYTARLWSSTSTLVREEGAMRQRELRASVGLLSIELDMPNFANSAFEVPIPVPAGHIFSDIVLATIKNYGLTPAFDVVVTVNWMPVVPFGARLPSDFKYPDQGTSPIHGDFASRSMVDPQRETIHAIIPDRLMPFRAAKAAAVTLYFYGHIDYTDTFERKWRRDFCFIWEPWRPKGLDLVPYHEHNNEYEV